MAAPPTESQVPPAFATDELFDASVYPATLADGVTPRPRAGQVTERSERPTKLFTSLAQWAARGLNPGIPVAANRLNAYLHRLSTVSLWAFRQIQNAAYGTEYDGHTELDEVLTVSRMALFGAAIDESYLSSPGTATIDSAAPSGDASEDVPHLAYNGSIDTHYLTADLHLENLTLTNGAQL